MSPRPRERIIENLETIYREAYDRAKESGDARRMEELDSSFQREQLLIEVLLDVRDGLRAVVEDAPGPSALEKIQALRKLTRLR
jgi:hypothetical protein